MEFESHFGLMRMGLHEIQIFKNIKIFSWFYDIPLFEPMCNTVEAVVTSKYQAINNGALISLIAYDSI